MSLFRALQDFASAVQETHPGLAQGVRVVAELSDDERRKRIVDEFRRRGEQITQQAIDAALNGRR